MSSSISSNSSASSYYYIEDLELKSSKVEGGVGYYYKVIEKNGYVFFTCSNSTFYVTKVSSSGILTDITSGLCSAPGAIDILGNYIVVGNSGGFKVYHFDFSTEILTLLQTYIYSVGNYNNVKLEQASENIINIYFVTNSKGILKLEYNISENTVTKTYEVKPDNNYYNDVEITDNYVLSFSYKYVRVHNKSNLSVVNTLTLPGSNAGSDIEIRTLNGVKYLFVAQYSHIHIYSFNDSNGTFSNLITSLECTCTAIKTKVLYENIILYTHKYVSSSKYRLQAYSFNGVSLTFQEEASDTVNSNSNGICYNNDFLFLSSSGIDVYAFNRNSNSSTSSSSSLSKDSKSSLSESSTSSHSSRSSDSSSLSNSSDSSSLSKSSYSSNSISSYSSSLSKSSISSDSSLSSISESSSSLSSESSNSSISITQPVSILTKLDLLTGQTYYKTYNKNRYVFCTTNTGLDVHKISNDGKISELIANDNNRPTGISITGIDDFVICSGGNNGISIYTFNEETETLTFKTGNLQSGNYNDVYVERFDNNNLTIFISSTTYGVLQYNYNIADNIITLIDRQDDSEQNLCVTATPNWIISAQGNMLYSYSRANNLISDTRIGSYSYGGTYYRELEFNTLNGNKYLFAAKDNGFLVLTIDETTGQFTRRAVVSGTYKCLTTRLDNNRILIFTLRKNGDNFHEIALFTWDGTNLVLCDTSELLSATYLQNALSIDSDFLYAGLGGLGLQIYNWRDNISNSSYSSISQSSNSSNSSSSNSSDSSLSSNSSNSSSSNSSDSSLSSNSSNSSSSNSKESKSSESSISSLSDSSSSQSSESSTSSISSISSLSISSSSESSLSSESSSSYSSESSISSISSSSNSSESSISSDSSLSYSSSSNSSYSSSSNSSESSISTSSISSNSSSSNSSESSNSNSSSSNSSISRSSESESSYSSNSSQSFESKSSSSDSSESSISSSSNSSQSSESSESSISSDSSSSYSSLSLESKSSFSSNSSSSSSSISSESSFSSLSSESSSSYSSESSISSTSSESSSSNSSISSESSSSNSSISSSSNSSESSLSSGSSSSYSSESSISSTSSESSSSNSSESSISSISSSSNSLSSSSNSSISSESSLSSISSNSSSSNSSSSNSSESSFSSISSDSSSSNSSSSNSSESSISSYSWASKSSRSSSSLMLEPIDWQITEALISKLSTMSKGYNTKVRNVQLIETEFKSPNDFPTIFVCPNEIDSDQEFISRNDFLPFALVYIDDSNETNIHRRFRNVPADIQKCIKSEQYMDSLAHWTTIQSWENSVFEIDGIEIPCCVVYIIIERRLDANNPYKLL